MIVLYGMAYRKLRENGISRHTAIAHGVSYGLLGLLMCFPLGGFFWLHSLLLECCISVH